ncbi:hypothetical protein HDU67_003807 [Dinochytrium kinnereticum]|nr:hypothetical protein HDU67_003807 [Dinochytrium kinnereticum]
MPSGRISLNVGLLTGKCFSVDIRLSDTVLDLKRRIEEEESIPKESQVLIFREKPLSNESSIGGLGIKEGSKLQLVVQMNGGPGPPVRIKNNVKKDESILFLLCKQDQGLYMLELHVKGETGSASPKNLLELADGQTLRVVSNGGKTILMGIPSDFRDLDENGSRPSSSDSTISTSSFLTYLESSPETSTHASCVPSRSSSRKTSASSVRILKMKPTPETPPQRGRSSRPATAISIMRQRMVPQITFVKSRPATAAKVQMRDISPSFRLSASSKRQEDGSSQRVRGPKTVRFTGDSHEELPCLGDSTCVGKDTSTLRGSARLKKTGEERKQRSFGSPPSSREKPGLQLFTSETKSRRGSPWTPVAPSGMKREESFKEAAKSDLIKDNPKVVAKKVSEI